MIRSIAHNGDLEFTKKDLLRYHRDIDNGPHGIFLTKSPVGTIFFVNSWAYPFFAAPVVRIFNMNGFPVFHAALLLVEVLAPASFVLLYFHYSRTIGLLFIASYLFASMMIALGFIENYHKILRDEITLPGLILLLSYGLV